MNNQLEQPQTDDASDNPEVAPEFCVCDEETANWVIRKIIESRAYAKRCAEWCNREQARAKRDEEFFMFRFGNQLQTYARRCIDTAGGRRKSIAFPAGVLGFRSERARLVIDDEMVVITWAKQNNPALIIITETLSKSAFNDHVEQIGEIPDVGVRIEPAREKFFIK